MKVTDRRSIATGVAGVVSLGLLFTVRAIASATTASVTVAGRELHWGGSFKQAFGIPCPTCGMSRSFLLALHGHVGDALGMNPGGPLLVFGLLLLSAAMFYLTFQTRRYDDFSSLETAQRRITIGLALYGGLMTTVLLAHWLSIIA